MKISVVIPSYNHENYIGQAIESVLSQTHPIDEVLVVDDASKDNSRSVISSYDVKSIFLDKNVGGAEVLNIGIKSTDGDFVAILNSDDYWAPNKIELQIEAIKKDPDLSAVFSNVNFIDQNNKNLTERDIPFSKVFSNSYSTSAEYLRHFFFVGNCLCHPSVLIRREVYEKVGLYNNSLRQLPDFDMWIRVLKHFRIKVLSQPLLNFRISGKNGNTSSRAYGNDARTLSEHYYIANSFFEDMSDELFLSAFSGDIRVKNTKINDHLDIEKALLFLNKVPELTTVYELVAIQLLMNLFRSQSASEVLRNIYGITEHEVHALSSGYDSFLKERYLRSGSYLSRMLNSVIKRRLV